MQKNILIVGGKGLVGKTIYRILKSRNPEASLFVGSRKIATQHNELTALSTVLHIESLFKFPFVNRIYFAHELHAEQNLQLLLEGHKTITVKVS